MSKEQENEIKSNIIKDANVDNPQEDNSMDKSDSNKNYNLIIDELTKSLTIEKQKTVELEDKLKRILADFQNLEKKSDSEIKNGVNTLMDKFLLDFLQIYDDFVRAKNVYHDNKINISGLDSILKNMDALLMKNGIVPIDALGEIFNPKLHEAISIIQDSSLDDDTITKEIRKGYISHNRVIRPTLVEISKKSK